MEAAALNPGMEYFRQLDGPMTALGFAPFALLLAMIACLPLMQRTEAWWGQNRNKALVAGLCSLAGIILFLGPSGDVVKLRETLLEYLTFMALLASLYVVCGGIHIHWGIFRPALHEYLVSLGRGPAGQLDGHDGRQHDPHPPLIRANRLRTRNAHVVIFFIFIVSNAGGLPHALGRPPLYLGFLQGVPFAWTFRLFAQWGILLLPPPDRVSFC